MRLSGRALYLGVGQFCALEWACVTAQTELFNVELLEVFVPLTDLFVDGVFTPGVDHHRHLHLSHLLHLYVLQQTTLDMWHVTLDTWHLTHHTGHMTRDTWHVTRDTWHLTHDMSYLKHDTRHMTIDMGHLIHDIWHMTCGTCIPWHAGHLIHPSLDTMLLDKPDFRRISFDKHIIWQVLTYETLDMHNASFWHTCMHACMNARTHTHTYYLTIVLTKKLSLKLVSD